MLASLFWIVVAALGAVLVLMLPSGLFNPVAMPLMWVMAGLSLIAGFLCIFVPGQLRRLATPLLKPWPLRLSGLLTVILGAALVRAAKDTDFPLFVQIIGAVAFIRGGVQVASPMVAVTILEWWLDLSRIWYRVMGLLCLALAALFLVAAGYIEIWEKPKPVERRDGVNIPADGTLPVAAPAQTPTTPAPSPTVP